MGWSYRRPITIDNTKVGGAVDHVNYPMYFAATVAQLKSTGNGGNVQSTAGYDIALSSDIPGATLLDYKLAKYDPTTGEFKAHVRIPTLGASSDTTIHLQYGQAGLTAAQGNPAGVFSTALYAQVNHLYETTGTVLASEIGTAGDFYKTTGAGTPEPMTGKLYKGQYYAGTAGNYAFHPNVSLFGAMTSGAFEGWFSNTSDDDQEHLMWTLARAGATRTDLFIEFFNGGGQSRGAALWKDGVLQWNVNGTIDYAPFFGSTNWHHFVLYHDGTQPYILFDGVDESERTTTTDLTAWCKTVVTDATNKVNKMVLGAYENNGGSLAFQRGGIEEFRIMKTMPNVGSIWWQTQMNNMTAPQTFFSIGAEINNAAGGQHIFNDQGLTY